MLGGYFRLDKPDVSCVYDQVLREIDSFVHPAARKVILELSLDSNET